jgi:choline dehydrogenase-like flavoprotein
MTQRFTKSDVCIVGAGPAGLTAALAIGSAGRTVTVLESGGWVSSLCDQELNDGDHQGETYDGLAHTRHRQVAGTVNIWNVSVGRERGAKFVPLSPSDLLRWPMGWKDLEPFYIEAQKFCGLGPFEYGAEYWASPDRRPFRLEGTGLESAIYQFGSAKHFTHTLVNKLQKMETITLVPSSTVVELLRDPGAHHLHGVRAIDRKGRVRDVEAQVVILACGAIENARLLLLAGLGTSSGWLGRGFMEHARDVSLTLVPHSLELFDEASFYDFHHSKDGALVGGRLAFADDALQSLGLPNGSMTLMPRARPHTSPFVNSMVQSFRRAFGVTARRRYGWSDVRSPSRVFEVFDITLNLEQRPHRWNRIELADRTDSFGQRLPRLILRWTDREQQELEELRELLGMWFRATRLGRLEFATGSRPNLSAHHHAGTTRMGMDPNDGVVNTDGRLFEVDNLYIAGASVFPTAGFANPTLTIVAMTLRLAKHVQAILR